MGSDMTKQGTSEVVPGHCPLCGRPNLCSRVANEACEVCWCHSATIPQGLLEQIPAEARQRACICRHCLEAYHQRHP